MALFDPSSVWGLGYMLSLAASLALAATAEFTMDRGIRGYVEPLLLASVTAQIATLPILLPLRGNLPLVSLPANVAIAPLVALAFPMSAIAGLAAALWRPAGELLAIPARLAVDVTIWLVDHFASFGPGISVGRAIPGVTLLVAAVALASCLALSREGQRFWNQWPERRARWSSAQLGIAGGVAIGLLMALAALVAIGA